MGFIYIIPSAINVTEDQAQSRLDALGRTLDSINDKVPEAKILVVDCAPTPLSDAQKEALLPKIDLFAQHNTHPEVERLAKTTASPKSLADLNHAISLAWVIGAALKNQLVLDDDLVSVILPGTELTQTYLDQIRQNEQLSQKVALSDLDDKTAASDVVDSTVWTFPGKLASSVLTATMDSAEYILQQIEDGKSPAFIQTLFKFLSSRDIYYTHLV